MISDILMLSERRLTGAGEVHFVQFEKALDDQTLEVRERSLILACCDVLRDSHVIGVAWLPLHTEAQADL